MTASPAPSVRTLPEGHAGLAVRALREGLIHRDVHAVQEARWLAPRPPGERDMLSDLAAAAGLETAVSRLSRFWADADVQFEAVRAISTVEAEVYERLSLPGEKLSIVSLVRRESPEAPWKVVCTNESDDDRFVLWIAATLPLLDDVS